jgi:acetolactate synthase-1/2/3 large subunit
LKVKTAIAKILKKEGVDFVTGFPSNPLFETVASENIRTIQARTERVAVNIADGFTRASFGLKNGITFVQWGPGSENAFSGVAHAFADSVPILIIPSGVERNRLVVPNFIATQNYQRVTKWIDMINLPNRASAMIRLAFSYMRNGRPGPVMLELPLDVAEEEIDINSSDIRLDGTELDSYAFTRQGEYKVVQRYRSCGDLSDIKTVAGLLLKAKNPIVRAGQGIHYAQAWGELRELAELLQIPVYTTTNGKSAFPENHPLSLGTGGRSRPKAVMHFHSKTDLVLGIGSSCMVEEFTTPIPAGKSVIQITVDERDINKDYPLAHAVIGDAKLVLRQLIDELKSHRVSRMENMDLTREIKLIKDEWWKEWMPRLTSDDVPISPYRVIGDVMKVLDEKQTIITHDSGNPRDQLLPFYQANTPGSYIGWGKSTTMGQSLGLIMGAKLAHPGKTCVHFTGDASFGMVGMDFETAVRERIPIITILLNNSTLGGHASKYPSAFEQYKLTSIHGDYSKVADGLGGYAERIVKPLDIIPAIQRAKKISESGKPALVEIMTREEPVFSR